MHVLEREGEEKSPVEVSADIMDQQMSEGEMISLSPLL